MPQTSLFACRNVDDIDKIAKFNEKRAITRCLWYQTVTRFIELLHREIS